MKEFSPEAALRHRYRQPEFAILFEVRNQTGFTRKIRSADAIAMSLYPSRGLEILGFEIKRSRGDWLNELRQPDKSAAIQKYCDRWYVVISDEAVVQNGELPGTWGLLVPRGSKLTCKVEAPKLTPEPIDRLFLASMMRNANVKSVDAEVIAGAVAIERERCRVACTEEKESALASVNRILFELRDSVKAFEEQSGVSLRHTWNSGHIGKAVKFVQEGGVEPLRKELTALQTKAQSIALHIESILKS